jgi:hypothetical protein
MGRRSLTLMLRQQRFVAPSWTEVEKMSAVEGLPVVLSKRHAKIRRDGYRRRRTEFDSRSRRRTDRRTNLSKQGAESGSLPVLMGSRLVKGAALLTADTASPISPRPPPDDSTISPRLAIRAEAPPSRLRRHRAPCPIGGGIASWPPLVSRSRTSEGKSFHRTMWHWRSLPAES